MMRGELQARNPGTKLLLALALTCIWLGIPARAETADTGSCVAAQGAVSSPSRSEADKARDAGRKPGEVLCFFGVQEGMQVLDLFSGSGYYTEIVSRLVGENGSVTAHNNAAYLAFAKEQIAERYMEGRLANVTPLEAEANDLSLRPGRYDAALMVLAYHDIYYVTEDGSWPTIDGPRLLAEIFSGLKPGGVLGVVDHIAKEGAPAEVGTTLHRIDPQRVRREIEAAGFIFDGSTEILRNFDDDHTKPMFDPSVRGRTDRLVYRFRKPE